VTTTDTPNRWGKAGQRLTEQEIADRGRAVVGRRNQQKAEAEAREARDYRLWAAGLLKPWLITFKLDAMNLYGPEVDVACGAREPDVDLWEAGRLYPTWEQTKLLAKLVGCTPGFLCAAGEPFRVSQTTLRFHGHEDPREPLVWSYPPEVVTATIGKGCDQ
jgi:hypothetical protein